MLFVAVPNNTENFKFFPIFVVFCCGPMPGVNCLKELGDKGFTIDTVGDHYKSRGVGHSTQVLVILS